MKHAIVAAVVMAIALVMTPGKAEAATYRKSYYKKPVAKKMVKRPSYHAHVYSHYYTMHANTEGRVVVTWDVRGGDCQIAYGHAGTNVYQYRTAASCNEGSLVIGGLEPGKMYAFAVKSSGGGSWQGVHQKSARATATSMPITRAHAGQPVAGVWGLD